MGQREKFDRRRPDARPMAEAIVHGAFITEGTMVAFPTCFPGVTVPLPGDESRLTALDVAADGMVYAGTSGHAAHLLVGMFHGVTGMVFDMGRVAGAKRSAAVVCGQGKVLLAANGPGGGCLVAHKLEPLPFDLIQEWHVARSPLEDVGQALGGEEIIHVIGDGSGKLAIGVTPTRLFCLDLASSELRIVAKVPGRGRLGRGGRGGIFGTDEKNSLWHYDPADGRLRREVVGRPAGPWPAEGLRWARDTISGTLYTADGQGRLYAFDQRQGFSSPLAQVPVAPVGPMAVTLDGRVYGTYGEGMSMLFCYDPDTATLSTLGVAVSVLERRRYGYSFGDAAVGRDGQVFFGEDDDLGHLWMYFPRIKPKPKHQTNHEPHHRPRAE